MKTVAFILGLMLVGCSGVDSTPSEDTSQNESRLNGSDTQEFQLKSGSASQECSNAGGFCTKGSGCRGGAYHQTITCDHDQGCCIPN